jgi:hypothetical protein
MTGSKIPRNTLVRGLYYWFLAYVSPVKVIDDFRDDSDKALVSFWIILVFSFLYALTALLGFVSGQEILVDPWIPIPAETYYLYQFIWTIPWGLATWLMLTGICHLVARVGKKNGSVGSYDDTLLVVSIGWVLPWFICGWLPETLILIPFGVMPPAFVEIMRLGILSVIYQTVLVALGMRRTHNIGWIKGVVIGLVTNAVNFIMFFAFLR